MNLLKTSEKIPFFKIDNIFGFYSVGWIKPTNDSVKIVKQELDWEELKKLPGNNPFIIQQGEDLILYGTMNFDTAGSFLFRHHGTSAEDILRVFNVIDNVNRTAIPIVMDISGWAHRKQCVYRAPSGWTFVNLDSYADDGVLFPVKLDVRHTSTRDTISLIVNGEKLIEDEIGIHNNLPVDDALNMAKKMEVIGLFSLIKDGEIPLIVRKRDQITLYKFGILDYNFDKIQDIPYNYWRTLTDLKDFVTISVRPKNIHMRCVVNGKDAGNEFVVNRSSDYLISDVSNVLSGMGLDLLHFSNDASHNLNRIYSSSEEKDLVNKLKKAYRIEESEVEK